MRYLLVQPKFPIPSKSHNHSSFLPVGLLKLGAWLRDNGHEVELVRGLRAPEAPPDEIYITSLFTYWASAVWDAVAYYKQLFPNAVVTVGGIYASLAPDHCAQSGCDHVFEGVHAEAEKYLPAYDLVDTDFQIVHASRGCIRRCNFCGTYRIEPKYEYKRSVLPEIVRRHLVFYDNNLLANPKIDVILDELSRARFQGRVVTSECQSGFDGRLLTPDLARKLKAARFRNPRIAWDGPLSDMPEIERQLQMLSDAGYSRRDTYVFMIFNFDLPPEEMIQKADACFGWGVQVADCRFRPLDLFADGYKPMKKTQAPDEYYLHPGWTDADVRGFRRLVRENNICVRYRIPRSQYDKRLEGLTTEERERLAAELGLDARRLNREQLDLLNRVWLESMSVAGDGSEGGLVDDEVQRLSAR